ncbi:MAG: GNAT family N-acetyltransferase [Candidatus Faecousia sp.]|nr:GNAT family N-acetyltransferase [Bacillota bacterium]MDY4219695.1 GNAT family N-acetyltransferase [Candidatus Faecousia sp.]
MTSEQRKALDWLSREPALHISMTEPLRLGKAQGLAVCSRGVALTLEDVAMVAAEDLETALHLVEQVGDWNQMTVAGSRLTGQVCQALGLKVTCPCHQAVYWGREPLAVEGDIRPLDMGYFPQILEGYHLFHDPEYIEERIGAGVFFGAFVDGQLAGFVGEHSEGSMGMLEIFPAYRRRGLGYALECFQINRYLSQGRVPFDQVVVGNEKSMSLQKKVGMELSRDTVSWLAK